LSELEANSDTIFSFIQQNRQSEIGMCMKSDLQAFLTEFTKQRFAATIPPCEQHQSRADVLKYEDFVALISPKNRDFAELMLQRQADYELQ